MSPSASNVSALAEPARYELIAKLGQGGMARVFLVLARGPAGVKKLLVTKELLPELAVDPDFVAMFLDEARIALRLNHPNVIQTYEVGSAGELPTIVMEYLEGHTLNALLNRVGRAKMPLGLHLHIIAEVLAGLHHAHEICDFDGTPFGVVHRDVSPHNVFVTYDGQIKLVDFGIAKATCTDRTRTGVWKGKANYAAPEQMMSTEIDRRTDIFSVGVMLWEALAERRLAADLPEIAMMQRRVTGTDPGVANVNADVPPELARICDRAMQHLADDRYPTADEMRADIAAYLESTKPRGSREVADLMTSSFAVERAKLRTQIDIRVKELGRAAASAPSLVATEAVSADMSSSGLEAGAAQTNGHDAPSAAAARPRIRDSGRRLAALGVVAGVLGLVAWGASRQRAPSGGEGALVPPEAPVAQSAYPAVDATPPEEQVDVAIAASPAAARLFLDDVELASNPFRGKMVRSAQPRHLRCVAAGFVTDEQTVSLDADLRVDVTLRASPPPPGAGARPRSWSPSPSRPPPAREPLAGPTAGVAPPLPPSTGSTRQPPAPGDALTPAAARRSRSIDEKF
jgi:eukaryotic-like serine/threonine-protein kinase